MKITNFQGNQFNAKEGTVREYTLEQLSNLFSSPEKGQKHIGYFVRGELNPTERKDKNLASADVLVLDGDRTSKDEHSCCPPIDAHIALKELNINHFIYTTHSHSFNKNKFRVVIPCKLDNKQNLKYTVSKILSELIDKDVDIYNVKEMNTWSQPWFIPSRDDPDDGLFEHYEYLEGKDYEQVIPEDEKDSLGNNGKSNDSISNSDDNSNNSDSVSDIIGNIINGGEGLHHSINKYAYMQIKDGIAPKMVAETLRGLMMANQNRDERWQDRYNEIDRSVQGAVEKLVDEEKIDVSDIKVIEDKNTILGEIPWPPGLLGQLAQDAFDMQLYQYRDVAVVSAIGLIAGIAGRKFNVSRTGLNVYLTLIMETGMGKDSIGKFITHCLFQAMNDGDGNLITPSFLGKSKYTGAKAIVNSMKNALSQISVFTEAGLLMQTQSGDQSGLLRALLDIYTKSGNNDIFIGAEYSDSDKSVPSLRAPALSIINESTADNLQQAFKDNNSIDSGHLPRQSIYRIIGNKPYMNKNAKVNIGEECMSRLQELISTCSKVQSAPSPRAYEFELEKDVKKRWNKLEKYFTDEYNKYKNLNNNKANMATRMPLKALKFAAIASVFNHHTLFINMPEWEWAEQLVRYEYDGVDNFFMSAGSGEMSDIVTHVVGPVMIKMLNGHYKSVKTGINSADRKSGIIPLSVLAFNLRNNSACKKLDDDTKMRTNPKTGVQKVVDYMLQHEYLVRVDDPFGRRRNVYRVTNQFKILMS